MAACLDKDLLCHHLRHADLIALVNWSELDYSHNLWEQVYRKCISTLEPDKSKYVFFDLCDIARKNDAQVRKVLELIKEYSQKRHTVLSLNKNEARRLGACIGAEENIQSICTLLSNRYAIDEVIVHTRQENVLVLQGEHIYSSDITTVEDPAVLTGAGDHFNAAYCAALLLNVSPNSRLRFSTDFATAYVKTGQIPAWEEEQ